MHSLLQHSTYWRSNSRSCALSSIFKIRVPSRFLHHDGWSRLSNLWAPTIKKTRERGTRGSSAEDSHSMLIRAGFIRQTHSGLFQFLPFGLRVQEKVETLLDKHMKQLGASKISLSTFSSEDLWKQSGRWQEGKSELFALKDRKGAKYLLSPTHEEEITSIVADAVHSYKELPLRLYQITRKYRDELRPRQGLLRTREFLMKDLYTFDATKEAALRAYEAARLAYSNIFQELKLPVMVAAASSGTIGGDLSHEYHLPLQKGEDSVFNCSTCDYVANEEVAVGKIMTLGDDTTRSKISSALYDHTNQSGFKHPTRLIDLYESKTEEVQIWTGVSQDHQSIYQAILPSQIEVNSDPVTRPATINLHALKKVFHDVDLSIGTSAKGSLGIPVDEAMQLQNTCRRSALASGNDSRKEFFWKQVFDFRVPSSTIEDIVGRHITHSGLQEPGKVTFHQSAIGLVKLETGDLCPSCDSGILDVEKAVELGHTFYLGTKYSEPLGAKIATEKSAVTSPMEMGCHGIGVSRLIGAVAERLADEKGLNWPRLIAPFEVVVIPGPGHGEIAIEVLDSLAKNNSTSPSTSIDAVLDDRDKGLAWKITDADLIGYPVIVVLGRTWAEKKRCEVQCRQLKVRQEVPVEQLRDVVESLLAEL